MVVSLQGAACPHSHKTATASQITNSFLKFSDLDDLRVVVIHTGEQASRDARTRVTLQRAHNEALITGNPIDPEVEPEQTLYVGPSQLGDPPKLYKMADSDATKKIVVHQLGNLAPEKAKRLIIELMKQAPNAEIYRGNQGHNATPWQLVDVVMFEQALAAESLKSEKLETHPPHLVRESVTAEKQDLPEGFRVKGNRLCSLMVVGRGEDAKQEWIPISSPIRVLAETADEYGRGYGRLLEWQDSAGRIRQWAMPVRSLVPRNGEEVFAALLDAGLPFIELGYKRKLAAYLMSSQPARRIPVSSARGGIARPMCCPVGPLDQMPKMSFCKQLGTLPATLPSAEP